MIFILFRHLSGTNFCLLVKCVVRVGFITSTYFNNNIIRVHSLYESGVDSDTCFVFKIFVQGEVRTV